MFLGGGSADTNTALGNSPDSLSDLRKIMAPDNVHFTAVGYSKIAVEIAAGISKLVEKESVPSRQGRQYYWHGFSSPNGSNGPRLGGGNHGRPGRGGGRGSGGRGSNRGSNRQHPYRR